MKKIKRFLLKWNEFITIPLGLLLMYHSETIITYFFPLTPRYSAGFLYDVIHTIATWLIFNGVAYFIFKLKFPVLERIIDNYPYAEDDKFRWLPVIMLIWFQFSLILTALAVF